MKINFKVVRLDGTTATRRLRTPAHRRLTAKGVEWLLLQEADRMERFFPGLEFRLVPLRDGNFNFVEIPVAQ
jgi:hypothetical protein